MRQLSRYRSGRSTLSRWGVASATALAIVAPALAVQNAAATDVADCSTVPWMNTSSTPAERAQALLDASTLQQKYRWLNEQAANSPQTTTFGQAAAPVVYPAQVPCTPTVVYTDGPDGVRGAGTGVTAFPAPIAVASTWDQSLAYDKGVAQADEAFGKRKNVVLGPGIASGRTPLSGRTPEYLGEDSLLSGLLAASGINGLESSGQVFSDIKHFVANEQETDRQTSSSNIDERTLREVYDRPVDIALQRSDPESVMCSYNQINHIYSCENPLLNTLLKGENGFDGYVMSDFGAVHSTAQSLKAGLDQELNRPIWYTPARLDAAIAAGQITEADVDAAALRVVTSYIRGGVFDHPLPATAAADVSTSAHKALAKQLAEDGSVLLKNSGALPLAPTQGQKIALFGPTASSTPTNGVSATSVCSMTNTFRPGAASNSLPCEDVVSAETAITQRAAQAGATVTWNDGTDLAAATDQAKPAAVAIVFGYQRTGEFADLPNLNLQGNGDALVSAVEQANDKTVVVLQTGSAVEMPWIDGVQGVLESWYAGEQQGPAIASLLFGAAPPSGKLPMTFPTTVAQTPTNTPQQYPGVRDASGIRQVDYTEGLAVGYKWYQSQGLQPLFPFGYGLSYTTFSYDRVQVTPQSTNGSNEVRIQFKVTNTGTRAGTETAQAYVALPSATGEPGSRLVGWQKLTLQPGEHANVTITLSPEDLKELHLLQYWDAGTKQWTTAQGTYSVAVGGSSAAPTGATFTIK